MIRRASTPTAATRALGLALVLVATSAGAQDRASAEDLFQLGKGAMARSDYPKACGYFQASLNADFALGTLLNLAICHEQAGKVASAWSEFRTLEEKAARAKPPQTDRVKFAHDHADALRPRLSRLHVVVAAEDKAMAGFTVKIDNVVAQPELFDVGVPVDVGKRTVTATANGHETWAENLVVDDEKMKLDVTIPALKLAPKAPPPPSKPDPAQLAAVEQREAAKSQRTIGFVVGGIGVASLGVGTVFGILALGAKKDTACGNGCINGSSSFTNAHDAFTRANTFGWISNITLAAGVIGAGIGTYLVLSAGSDDGEPSKITAGFSPAGFTLGGTL